jgi:UDP-N-acetylmuramate: L-alanyl-gamma-D-glutamyl-meso-diaminopimelate ligase
MPRTLTIPSRKGSVHITRFLAARLDITVAGWYQPKMIQEALKKHAHDEPPLLQPAAAVHLLGICGTGMASLAGMFHERGFRVSGSDQAMYPPMSDFLADMGIKVSEGYRPGNLYPLPDLAVVGNVIRRANPEAVELEKSGVPYVSMPEALNRYFIADKTRIVVGGTHGKTTLSSMIAWILYAEGRDPGFMIGGLPGNFRKNHRLGQGRFFVLEGDEYDTAYFDKRPKFLHYDPHIAVVTSCEFDHADIYENLDQIVKQFRAFMGLVPQDGCIVACGDDQRVREMIEDCRAPVQVYGFNGPVHWSAAEVTHSPNGIRATILNHDRRVAVGTLPLFGAHNLLNAVAAIAVAEHVGISPQRAMEALRAFQGVKRRQEILGEEHGMLVIDDFAHHPTAVEVTLAGVRSRFPDRRLVAVFEPRTNTSRRSFFQQHYASALMAADLVAVRSPRDVDKLPEWDRFDSERLAENLRSIGRKASAFADTEALLDFLSREVRTGDVVLVMSNGSFDKVGSRLLEILRERGT